MVDRDRVIAESRAVLARHARTFNLAGKFLRAEQQDEAAILYAFCRLVDDLVDEAPDIATGAHALAEVEAELRGEAPPRPLVEVFSAQLHAHHIDRDAALELIAGVRSDAAAVALADDAELLRYCYRVAGTVGLMMCGVLGVRAPEARAFALDLGIAMQLTNICRDVAEDAARGRVYLPATRLAQRHVSGDAVLRGQAPRPVIATIVLELLALADAYYASAGLGMRFIPWPSRLAILVAGRAYRAIGLVLRARDGDALAGRAIAPAWLKLLATGGALVRFGLSILPAPPPRHDPALHRLITDLPGTDDGSPRSAASSPPRKPRFAGFPRLISSRPARN